MKCFQINIRSRFLLLLFLIIGIIHAKAQTPRKFLTVFGGAGYDNAYDIKQTLDRCYIIAGSTSSFGKGNTDVYVIKVDSTGRQIWYKSYGSYNNDIGKAIVQLPDSGYVIAGFTNSFGNGGYDVYVIRTDKKGELIWEKPFGGFDWDFANDLVLGADGNIVVAGTTTSFGYGKTDGYLLNIDVNTGAKIWEKIYGNSEDDEFKSIKLTSDGMYTIAGNTKSMGDINGDFWFFKAGFLGDSITSKKITSTSKAEICYDFMEDRSNRLVFCGSKDTSYANVGKNISYAIKTDLTGLNMDELVNPGGFTNDDKFTSVASSKSNKYCFARKVNNGGYKTDVQPFLTDFNFSYMATSSYGGKLNEESYKIISTKDNGYAIVGSTNSFGNANMNVFLLKMDSTVLGIPDITAINDDPLTELKKDFYYDKCVYFNTSTESTYCKLYNYEGKLVEEGLSENGTYKIKKSVTTGIYILSYPTEKTVKNLKFIVEE